MAGRSGDAQRDQPDLPLTNELDVKPADLVGCHARQTVIENAIAESTDFFHMDALPSAVPLKIDADPQLTLMASTLYRLLGRCLGQGHERARQLFERFVGTAAKVRTSERSVEVRLGRRAYNPPLIAAWAAATASRMSSWATGRADGTRIACRAGSREGSNSAAPAAAAV